MGNSNEQVPKADLLFYKKSKTIEAGRIIKEINEVTKHKIYHALSVQDKT